MATSLFWLAVVTLLLVLATTIEFAIGNRSLSRLGDLPPFTGSSAPKVSVIIAARNEARNIERGLKTVLAQDYPNIEFIVVDDRSTDETGCILDRIAGTEPRLHVAHVTDLPGGWLVKTHTLNFGAERATGELLLFTDADVVMEHSVISRAVGYLLRHQIDHLAITPQLQMPGTLLSMFGGAFALFFGLYAKPWKARDPNSPRHIGIGAFNLVRAEVYRAVGGHRAIAMRPDDDMKLGKLIKKHGFRQEMVIGDGLITVEWYSSGCGRGGISRPTGGFRLARRGTRTHERHNVVAQRYHHRTARRPLHGHRALPRLPTLALRGPPRYGTIVSVHYLASHAEDIAK